MARGIRSRSTTNTKWSIPDDGVVNNHIEHPFNWIEHQPPNEMSTARRRDCCHWIVKSLNPSTSAIPITHLPERDLKFIQSLNDAAHLSEKQCDYIIGDDNHLDPKGMPSLAKRYMHALEETARHERGEAVPIGSSPFARDRITDSELDALQRELDQIWVDVGTDFDQFMKRSGVAQKRTRYLALTA